MEYLYYGLVFVAGWKGREWYAAWQIKAILNEIEQDRVSETKVDKTVISIERHDDMLFVYDESDGTFLCKGENLSQIKENLTLRSPNKRFTARPSNLQELGIDYDSI